MSTPSIPTSQPIHPIDCEAVSQHDLESLLEIFKPLAQQQRAYEPLEDLVVHKKITRIPENQMDTRSFFTQLMGQRILLKDKEKSSSLPFILTLYGSNPTLFENPDLKRLGFNPLTSFSIQDLDSIFYWNDPILNRFFDIPPKICSIMAPLLQLLNDPDPSLITDQEIIESFNYILRFCNQYTSRFLEAFMIEDSFIDFFIRQPHFIADLFQQNRQVKEYVHQKLQDNPLIALKPLKSGKISLYYHFLSDPFCMILDALSQIEEFSFSDLNSRALSLLYRDTSMCNIIRFLLIEDKDERKGVNTYGVDIRLIGTMHKLFVDLIEGIFHRDSPSIQRALENCLRLKEPEAFLYELSTSKELSKLLLKESALDLFAFTNRLFRREHLFELAPFFLSSYSFLSPDNKHLLIRFCGGQINPLEKRAFDEKVQFLLKSIFSQASKISTTQAFLEPPEEEKRSIGSSISDFSDVEVTTDRGVIKNPKSGKPLKISKSTAFYLFDVREAVSYLTEEREEYALGLFYYWNSLEMRKSLLGLYPFLEPIQKAALLPFLEIKELEAIEIGDTSAEWIHLLTHVRSDCKIELLEGKHRLFFAKIAAKERALLSKYDFTNPKNDYFENLTAVERKKTLEKVDRFLREIQEFMSHPLILDWDISFKGVFAAFMENIDQELNLVMAILEKRYPQLV